MESPTKTYDAEQEDERVRAALILRATAISDLLRTTLPALREVTEAIITDHGTRDASGRCRLCHHDHDNVATAAKAVGSSLIQYLGLSRASLDALAAQLLDAAAHPHAEACPCDLPQVGSPA